MALQGEARLHRLVLPRDLVVLTLLAESWQQDGAPETEDKVEGPGLLGTGRRWWPREWPSVLASPGASYGGPCSVVTCSLIRQDVQDPRASNQAGLWGESVLVVL